MAENPAPHGAPLQAGGTPDGPALVGDAMSLRLVHRDAAGSAFWSYSVAGPVVTVLSGRVGGKTRTETRSCATEAAAVALAARLLAVKVKAGYVAGDLPVQRRRFAEVRAELHVAGNAEQPDDQVLVIPTSVRIPHALWMDYRDGWLWAGADEPPVAGILVLGDLDIDGCLVNWEDDYGPFLEVHGNLTARSVATGGSQIHVGGDLTTGDLVGVYNHGCVSVDGDLTARTVATEHTVKARGITTDHRYDGWGAMIYAVRGNVVESDNPYEPKGVFAAPLVGGGSVDLRSARRWLADGRAICRPNPTSVREDFRKRVGRKLAVPETVKSLTLNGKDLTSLPEELFAFRNLEKLDLTHNQLVTLPDRLGELTELRELRLRGNGLRALPASIGNLTKLRYLDLEANCLVGLPAELARCTRLTTVILTNNPYSYVRSSFGRWRDVELMWSLPECLFELPALERLTFNQTFVRSLPARPFTSPRLALVKVHHTLLLDHDPALHPQLVVDADSSRKRAVDYIRYWFDDEKVRLPLFYDQHHDRYDFTDITALFDLVLRIAIPTAAPYDTALETFERQADVVARGIYGQHRDATVHLNEPSQFPATVHIRRLFAALAASLDRWEHDAPDNPLICGLRPILLAHT